MEEEKKEVQPEAKPETQPEVKPVSDETQKRVDEMNGVIDKVFNMLIEHKVTYREAQQVLDISLGRYYNLTPNADTTK